MHLQESSVFLISRPLKVGRIIYPHSFHLELPMCFYVENTTCAAVLHNLDGYRGPELFVLQIP